MPRLMRRISSRMLSFTRAVDTSAAPEAGELAPRSSAAKNAVGRSVARTLTGEMVLRRARPSHVEHAPDHEQRVVHISLVWMEGLVADFASADQKSDARNEQ